jgi:hypothetical protein
VIFGSFTARTSLLLLPPVKFSVNLSKNNIGVHVPTNTIVLKGNVTSLLV